jgi:hypothetical protein
MIDFLFYAPLKNFSSYMETSVTAHFVAPAHFVAMSHIGDSVPWWTVHFVANCIETKCASIATFPGAYFVATRGCS